MGLLVLLGGCVYLRLLEVKKQLRNFDGNFAISGEEELVIEFKNPPLKRADVVFLVGAPPFSERGENGETLLHYEFERVGLSSVALPPLAHLSINFFLRKNKLTRVIVPADFLTLFPRETLVETLKQAKDADVFEMKKLARGTIRLNKEVEAQLPSLAKTRQLLGEPLRESTEKNLRVLCYRYRVSQSSREVPIEVQLRFDSEGLLHEGFVHWDQSSIETFFVRE